MSTEIQLAKLYDPQGHVITEWHPGFEARKREIAFGVGGYNPNSSRRGSSGGLYQNANSESWAKNRDRLKAMFDARDAVTYDWIGGVLARAVLYTCGKISCKSMTGDRMIDDAYDEYFHGWCGDERADDGTVRCDITGRHRFSKLVQMSFLQFLVDGDHGFVEINPQFSPTGEYCLQAVEADRIGSPLESTTQENYIGGVGLDPITGRVQFYRVFRRTRTNQYVDKQEVTPDSFIHVFDPERSDEYRGRTKLLRCLNDLRDIREWIEAEKIAGKTQSQWAALIGLKDPFNGNGPGGWDGKTAEGTPSQDAQWGKILKMAEGETFSMLSPSARPSGAFMSFVQMLVRKMAQSLGLSYGFLWDLATLGGVMARVEVQSDLRRIQYWQDNVLTNIILNRVRHKVIAQGIAQGMLPAHPYWRKCKWSFGPWIITDAGYEMDNDLQAVSAGIMPIEDVTQKYGYAATEVAAANADTANAFVEIGGERMLPVEAFARGLFPDITNQKAAYMTPTPQPPPEPGTIEAIGDKGVGKMIEIFEKVGDGKIDRASAIEQMVRIFSIDRAMAEKIVPDEPAEEDLNRAAGLTPEGELAPVVAGPKQSSNGSNGSAKKKTAGAR